MSFIVGLLTFLILVNCLFLIFLVLIQLPKKDTGAGLAFGGGAADALFGAGSGNALTKITKYATVIFFGLALLLGVMQERIHRVNTSEFEKQLQQQQQPPLTAVPPPTTPPPGAVPATNASGLLLPPVGNASSTATPATAPAPATTGTNAPAK